MKTFKVGIVPGSIKEVVVEDEYTTIKELFELAGLNVASGYAVRANGETIDMYDEIEDLPDGSGVYASKMIKGN